MPNNKVRFLTLTAAVLMFPLALSAAPFDRGWIKERVLDKLSDVLGRRVEVLGDIDIDLSWTPRLRAERVRIENAEWSDNPYMAELGVLEASIDLGRLLKGQLVIPELTVLEPRLLLEVSAQNQANWHFAAAADQALPQAQDIAETALDQAIEELKKSGEPPPQPQVEENPPDLPLIKKLHVETGRFRYLNHLNDVDLEATLDSVDGQMDAAKTAIEIRTTIEQQPVSLSVNGGSFYALNRADQSYPLGIDIKAEDFRIGLQGDLRNPLNLGGGELALMVEGAGMPALVNAWTGSELPPLPAYRLTARMQYDGGSRWQLNELNARFGASDLTGALNLDTAGARPRITAELHSDTLDAAELNAIASGLDLGEEAPDNQPIIINFTPLQQVNAEFALNIVKLIAPGDVNIDDVIMQARLEKGQLDLQPLRLTIGGGSVSGELSLNSVDALSGHARLMLDDVDLGQAMNTLKQDDNGGNSTLLGIVNGSTEVRLVETETDGGKVVLSTLLDNLRLDDSELRYQDADAGTDLQLNLAVTGAQHELTIKAGGEWQNQHVMLNVQGGPVATLDEPGTPYKISGKAAIGGLSGQIDGAISHADGIWQLHELALAVGSEESESGTTSVVLNGNLDTSGEATTGQLTLDLGQLDLAALAKTFGIDQPLPGQLAGKLSVTLTDQTPGNSSNLAVPGFGLVNIEPSELRYTAPELDIDVTATLSSRVLKSGKQQIVAKASGRYHGEAFKLSAHGGSPLLLMDSAQAYPLSAELTVAETTLKVSGELPQPIDPNHLTLDVAVAGPDPAVLEPLLGFALPVLPPYQLEGQLKRQNDIIEINNFSGRIGDSDIGGDIRIEPQTKPLTLYATLTSNKVDLDDLSGLIGGAPDADAGETASAEQRQQDRREQQSPYLLPHKPLNLRKTTEIIQGVIKFRGKRVEAPKLPIDDIELTLKIDKGVLTLEPLTFGVGNGTITSTLSFDTGKQPVEGRIESEIQRVNLKKLLAPFEIADDSLGVIGGRIKLWVYGDSLADFFASADGGLFLLMTQGRLDVLLTELAGLDIGEALVALAGDVDSVPIDCAYIDAHSEKGILKLETAVVDTSDTVFLADGFIDFGQELVGIVVEPQPKDISLLSFRSPLHIEGRLKKPSVYPGPSELLVRGIAAVLLGIATPVAALLPLIEPGTGEDTVYCNGLIDAIDRAQ